VVVSKRTGSVVTGGGAALRGVVVLDLASHAAGPNAARYLGDFGAEVIKIERPGGDPMRKLGWLAPDGDSYFWKVVGRNKRCVTIDLKSADGKRALEHLVEGANVLVENLRPGGLERLGLGPDRLLEIRSDLVILRISGYGQTGPYSSLPGFATAAEAIGGYAGIAGEPDGKPLLPPLPVADETAGLAGAFATMVALRHSERTGEGQVVDVNLADVMVQLLGPLIAAYAHEGILQARQGSALPYTAPRGTYACRDGRWIALSASSEGVAKRLLSLLGCADDERFATAPGRLADTRELDLLIEKWAMSNDQEDALKLLRSADVVAAPVYGVDEIIGDQHFQERKTVTLVGDTVMQGLIADMSRTPGLMKFAGRPLGSDQELIDGFVGGER
jgi:crotonobetainyl-CoA:carnitine CoA-transferase CaiB-like acyl-CoA transferase